MKKYLITGALALVAAATMISCHTDDEFSDSLVANKLQTYEEVFKQEFGEINPTQNWGFSAPASARTRAEDKRLNEWGDPAKNGGQAWNVPPALTERQKLRVRLYFQYNPRLTYEDPGLTDFFVQQVYKGNPTTKGPYSPEEYYRVNDEKFTGSNEMDYLFCATETTHINDFNDGEWNLGTPLPVLNTGANANDYKSDVAVEGVSHLDQITLMVSSSTAYIGYGASTADAYKHKDCCALAGAWDIDEWVKSPEAQALGITDFGDPVYDPEWNRSFVGLDYEGMKKEDALSSTSVKALDIKEDGVDFVLYQGKFIKLDEFTDFVLKDKDDNEVKYLSDQVSNKSVGEKMKVKVTENGQEVLKPVTKSTFKKSGNREDLEREYNTTINGNSTIWYYDLDLVMEYINDGCNPTMSDKNMIKNIGGRDYVYSDWIVTLTEATKQGANNPNTDIIPIEPGTQGSDEVETWIYYRYKRQLYESGRIFCEDLGVISSSDLDFNDIVFDAYIYDMIPYKKTIIKTNGVETTNTGWVIDTDHASSAYRFADIFVLAGGGTLKVTLADQNMKDLWGQNVTDDMIVNTMDERVGSYGNTPLNSNTYGTILNYQREGTNWGLVNIPIIVTYGNRQLLELQADPGKAPHKICVPIETPWPYERIEIKQAYTDFSRYVGSRGSYSETELEKGQEDYDPHACWSNVTPETVYEGDGLITHIKYAQYIRIASSNADDNDNELYFDEVIEGVNDYHNKIEGGSSSGYQGGNNPDPVLIRKRH